MAPKPPRQATPCQNPDCGRMVHHDPGPGRPKKYCSDDCRKEFHRSGPTLHRARAANRRTDQLRQLVGENLDLAQQLSEIVNIVSASPQASREQPLRTAVLVDEIVMTLSYVKAAAIQQARDRNVPVRAIARAVNVSEETVRRRWPEGFIDRRLEMRPSRPRIDFVKARAPRPAAIPRQRKRTPAAARRKPDAPPPTTALARALSYLQHTAGTTHRQLAERAGVSPSYISHILSGRRCPSWTVAQKITTGCDGDPTEIRPLWEAERRAAQSARKHGATPTTAGPDTFYAALRGIHLAAWRPDPDAIHDTSDGQLELADITALLHGTRPLDWHTVQRFVATLRGDPAAIRPLWQAATHPTTPPYTAGPRTGPRAEAFG
ncbi:helix-turn-helix domain-containing protein [Streptomyces sp. NPDC127098]|uniref:helix-turn-helix domain-containing protein n=1 Tax=Streptomyces sp. NPDC127098 TaxID=3347137 RepID=UPI00365C896A